MAFDVGNSNILQVYAEINNEVEFIGWVLLDFGSDELLQQHVTCCVGAFLIFYLRPELSTDVVFAEDVCASRRIVVIYGGVVVDLHPETLSELC